LANAARYKSIDIFIAVADLSADLDECRALPLHSPIGKSAFGDAKDVGYSLTRFESHLLLPIRLAENRLC